MVLKNCGPKGYPGDGRGRQHAAASQAAEKGVTDMVAHLGRAHERTAYGTVVLHVCPEAAAGGTLALVRRRHDRAGRRKAQAVLLVTDDVLLSEEKSGSCPRRRSSALLEAVVDHVRRRATAPTSIFSSARAVPSCPGDNH